MVAAGASPRVVVAGVIRRCGRRTGAPNGARSRVPGQPDLRVDHDGADIAVSRYASDRTAERRRHRLPGRKPGDQRIRVDRPHTAYFRYTGERTLVAKEAASVPRTALGRVLANVRRGLFGRPLSSEEEREQRLAVATGMPVLGSDNISSSAYATEEIMRVLVFAGAGALALTMPMALVVVIVLAIVAISYRQTIAAYPKGGGSYIVASDNLGTLPGLTAAGAILTDYVLTVAVSIAAGVAALTSIFPSCTTSAFWSASCSSCCWRASTCAASVRAGSHSAAHLHLSGRDLRPVRGRVLPLRDWFDARLCGPTRVVGAEVAEPLGFLLILRAFASGCVALTGTEAVADGVPAFKPPEARNAQIVLLMAGFFASVFLGVSFLAAQLGIVPDPTEQVTVISQLTSDVRRCRHAVPLLIQISTAVLLVFAANTSFADFPRLSNFLARDGFLPRIFQFRGERLAFNTGIISLAAVALVLIVAFGGSVAALIPLYTVGVFIAFTLSQAGMVRRWSSLREIEKGWRRKSLINGVGALTTGIVAIEVAATKFFSAPGS